MRSIILFYKVLGAFLGTISPEGADVIIVGAGSAGIAAAVKLLENGIHNIIIVEGEGRIGGRVHTVNFEGRNIDLGAEWCHGQTGNIVYKTLQYENLLYLLKHEDLPSDFYLSTRQKLSDHFSEGFFESKNYAYPENMSEINVRRDKSLGQLMLRRYDESIAKVFKNEEDNLRFAEMAKEFLRHTETSAEAAFDWFHVSPNEVYEEAEGDQILGWRDYGYGRFLDVLTKKYPNPKEQLPIDDKIRFYKEVSQIIINKDYVNVVCDDNTKFKAKYVIFTPSLGVLKERSILFSPELPMEKRDAIERMGFGPIMKVFLKFEDAWWGNLTGFNFIWTDRDRRLSRRYFPSGPTTRGSESWITEHYRAIVMPNSNILSVWYTGEIIPTIEKMDEKILKDGIMYTLNLFLGHLYHIPKPQNIIRSSWHTNPHFRGSYSYTSVNSSIEDIRHLQAPVKNERGVPVLYFAGEATHELKHSTVHGAIETGFREANNVIKTYNTYKSNYYHY